MRTRKIPGSFDRRPMSEPGGRTPWTARARRSAGRDLPSLAGPPGPPRWAWLRASRRARKPASPPPLMFQVLRPLDQQKTTKLRMKRAQEPRPWKAAEPARKGILHISCAQPAAGCTPPQSPISPDTCCISEGFNKNNATVKVKKRAKVIYDNGYTDVSKFQGGLDLKTIGSLKLLVKISEMISDLPTSQEGRSTS